MNTGIITICGQQVALGRTHRWQTVTIHVAETTLAIELDDGETRVVSCRDRLGVRDEPPHPNPLPPSLEASWPFLIVHE